MPLTKAEAQGVARLFIRDYPGALELAYKFRENTAELYGPRAGEVPQSMKGGYISKETPHAGRMYRGRVEVPLENMADARDLLLTLRHEVLGHFGVNTFKPGEKRALLDGLIAAREEPSLKPLWADIEKIYADSSLDVRAEEVFSLHCEGVAPSQHVGKDQVQRGQQAFQETCLAPVRLMRADDLQSIACMVAQGLHDRTRTQQNFPALTELFRKKETDMQPKKPFHETVAEKLIEKLKEGTAPWQKPWQAGNPGAVMPINPTTGKRYKGINAIHLMSQGHSDQRWMTYKQAVAVDAQVRKGEKGTPIQYWKFSEEHDKLDGNGKPVLDVKGEPIKQTVKLERPRVFFATVFNAEQIDGLPAIQPRKQQDWNAVERAETILQASGAVIRHGEQNRAFYRPATDSIHLPDKGQFPTADNYYAIAMHELGHWTGHESRLDRDLANPFGSEGYAKEELRAEIASMILGDELGIGHDPEQHVAYVGSWIKVLQEDPLEIFRAAADAEKIQDYVLSLEQKQVQEKSTAQTQSVNPAAFLDSNGMLRAWDTADKMPADWQGVVKNEGAFWYVGQEAGERSFTVLAAPTLSEALAEAVIVKALAVDIGNVLNDPAYSFSHFVQAETLEDALRGRGLTTIGNVTGSDPTKYFEKALTSLSPVFGITPDHDEMGNPYLERKGLAQAFALKAEQLLTQLQQQKTQEEPMQQPSIDDLPGRLVDWLTDNGVMSRLDAEVTSALRDVKTGTDATRDVDTQALNEASVQAFGSTLPHDFTGQVQIVGVIERDGRTMRADEAGEQPEAFQVYCRKGDAQPGEDAYALIATRPTEAAAQDLADRLALIDAHSQTNGHEKAAKLARVNEERVRRDPNSTDEAISAAKETRKDAELAVMQNDVDFQRRVAEYEREERQASAAVPESAAHLMSSDEFAEIATAEPLENHGRRWEVFVGEKSFGFSDADTAIGAVQDAHKREVNNALYSRSTENMGAIPIQDMPPERVLSEYPDLREKFVDTVDFKQQASQAARVTAPERTYLDVPFKQKDEAKSLGAKWDRQQQSWYVSASVDPAPFAKWAQGAAAAAADAPKSPAATQGQAESRAPDQGRHYLAVPFGEHVAAKAAGAMWDKAAKSWYAGPKADMPKLERWAADTVPEQQGPAMRPEEEFAEALRSLGCVVNGKHPIMDGTKQRITVAGDKEGERAGFYVGHLDGHPAGYIKNNKTNLDMKWKSKGYALDPEQKAQMQAEAAGKLQARNVEHARLQEEAAQRVGWQMGNLMPVIQERHFPTDKQDMVGVIDLAVTTSYMQAKGIQPQVGAYTDKDGEKTYIPAYDVNGKQWSMQYIQEDGTKRFAKDSRKEGCFHVLGGMDALAKAPALVIGEGYATAGSLSESLGFATVAAFDSGNLAHVAKALHEKFPDKPIIIAGDDDKHLEATQGVNPGRSKAEEAAKAVGGAKMFPIFAPGEQTWPATLELVTPEKYREHLHAEKLLNANNMTDEQHAEANKLAPVERVTLTDAQATKLATDLLSDEQLAALNKMKRHTDFNDLANKSALGKDGINRQVKTFVDSVIKKHQAGIEPRQERVQKQEQPQPRRTARI